MGELPLKLATVGHRNNFYMSQQQEPREIGLVESSAAASLQVQIPNLLDKGSEPFDAYASGMQQLLDLPRFRIICFSANPLLPARIHQSTKRSGARSLWKLGKPKLLRM